MSWSTPSNSGPGSSVSAIRGWRRPSNPCGVAISSWSDGLAGQVAVALMVGAGPGHALGPELTLKPVLAELGACCPTRGLYLLESQCADPEAFAPWLERARPRLESLLGH
jgi:hypothetical protein